MQKLTYLLKTMLTMGRRHQSFIGAGWILQFLRLCPRKYKRRLALWILSLSVHYFHRDIDENYQNMSYPKFIELEYQRNDESRKKISEQILLPYLKKANTVIDYGCGPGFLAKYTSRIVNKVFAVDISPGVLECAKIINPSEKIIYSDVKNIDRVIKNNSIDLVYSFAVFQHVTDIVFEEILSSCYNKLKNEGLLLFHMPIEGEGLLTEEKWRKNKSIYGRVKWKYGLSCFYRTQKQLQVLLEKHGFESMRVLNIKEICKEDFDDICSQQLVIANKHTD